jgi:uncharacterized protein (DUF2141 family)
LALATLLVTLAGNALPTSGALNGEVDVQFQGLRSTKGIIRACLTRNPAFFPHCDKDPAAYKASIGAAPAAILRFAQVTPGDYALTVLHDENQNFRADMLLGIPREGVGFSRNPVLKMSAPKFDAVRFTVPGGTIKQTVKMIYFL